MNNQKTATTSPVISNPVNSQNRHHLHLVKNQKAPGNKGESNELPSDDLSIGDWVINSSSRPGEIVKIVELKPGYRSVWVRYSGDKIEQRENPEDLTPIDPDDIPEQSHLKTSELIFNYLEQQSDFVSEIVIATELNITVPVARQNLRELSERVEDDGNGNWRCVQSSVAEVVPTQCSHNWEFVPAPVEIGFAERCSHCNEVKYIEGSDKLEELIAWLSDQVEEFKQLSDKETDERKQAYYQNCARNKQQLIKQVNRHLAKAKEEEKGELLEIEFKLDQIAKRFFVDSGDGYKYIVDKKLYKSFGYKSFGAYCQERRGISARQAYNLINAAAIFHHLENANTCSQKIPLPTSEGQCRVLAKLPEPERADFLKEVASNNNGKIPSVRKLERIIKSRKEQMETPAKYQVANQEVPKHPIEIKYKAGQPIEYSLKFKDPKSYELLVEYFELTGAATSDGAIQRILTEAISQLNK
ncbi:MAG: hypothetical protein AB4206_04435 [Xenococcaceae cyanobacterium]